jgi:hypothetical protein
MSSDPLYYALEPTTASQASFYRQFYAFPAQFLLSRRQEREACDSVSASVAAKWKKSKRKERAGMTAASRIGRKPTLYVQMHECDFLRGADERWEEFYLMEVQMLL